MIVIECHLFVPRYPPTKKDGIFFSVVYQEVENESYVHKRQAVMSSFSSSFVLMRYKAITQIMLADIP